MLTRRRIWTAVFLTLTTPIAGLALAAAILPGTGRGPMRSMGEGHQANTIIPTRPSPSFAGSPSRSGEEQRPQHLQLDGPLKHGSYAWNDEGVPAGPITIAVDIGRETMSVYRGDYEIGAAAITFGAYENMTPLGEFKVIWKKAKHRSSIYDAPMPYTLRLTEDGVAIHGTDVAWGKATNGCIGVPVEFAALLFEQARLGDPVFITKSARPA